MAPGVAKTFVKELVKVLNIRYLEGIAGEQVEVENKLTNKGIEQKLKKLIKENKLILDKINVVKEMLRNEYVVELSDKDIDIIIKMAKDLTDNDTYQAMEALVHNLNSMHCLPYSELIWVYDTYENTFEPMKIGELTENFEPNRYKVVSLNKDTGKAEFKFITHAKDMGDSRELVTLVNNQGAKVTVTDNHKVMTIRDREITEDYPSNIDYTLTPRFIKTPPVNNDICLENYGIVRKDTPYQENHVVVNEAFAELMGYYIADGSLLGDTGTLCMSTCGKVPFEEMKELIREVFGVSFNSSVTYYDNSKSGKSEKDIRFGISRRLARMIADKFGKGSYNKKIPIEIMFGTDNIKEAFLKAYFRCDGRKDANYSEASTVSKKLQLQLAFMIQSLGGSVHFKSKTHSNDFKDNVVLHTISLSGADSVLVGLKDTDETAFSIPKYDLSMLGIKTIRKSGNLRYKELEDEVYTGNSELEKFIGVYINPIESKTNHASGEEHVYDISVEDNETFLTCEGIYVHNSRAGAQVPFSSLNYGTDTSPEGRLVIKNILKATEAGLGNGETAIFPISIFKVKEGVNYNKEDPNYDLFKYSMQVSAKRMFPNYTFVDAPYNIQYYKEGRPETEIATMGCVEGSETINYTIDGKVYIETFEDAYARILNHFGNEQVYSRQSNYIDVSKGNVCVADTLGGNGYTKVKKFIRNTEVRNWKTLKLKNFSKLTLTADHPLHVKGKGRVYVEHIEPGDIIYMSSQYINSEEHSWGEDRPVVYTTDNILLFGILMDRVEQCNTNEMLINIEKLSMTTKQFIRNTFESKYEVQEIVVKDNNESKTMLKVIDRYNSLMDFYTLLCDAVGKYGNSSISTKILTLKESALSVFLTGLTNNLGEKSIDRETRKESLLLNISTRRVYKQVLEILNRLGMEYKTVTPQSNKKIDGNVKFAVMLGKGFLNGDNIEEYTLGEGNRAREVVVEAILDGCEFDSDDYASYDVETESDTFDVSGICSHNCRTRVIGNVYDPNNEVVTGRGNLSFTSINLPRLAIIANNGKVGAGNIDKFYSLLDEMMELVHEQLLERFEVQCKRHPRNYPFLMGQGIWLGSDKLGPGDDIREILRHGTLAVGFIGLAETLTMLIGKHHGESEEAQKLGLEIIGYMRRKTDGWSQAEKMNYGVIGTPAEGLSGRYIEIDKKRFGIIKGVTDKKYYTNSSHIPVSFDISAFDKIRLEAPYHELENGGHICYIELDGDPSKNLSAFEKVIRCMHDNGVGYGAINHPIDRDPICGYVGIIGDKCPRCGRREGEALTEEKYREIMEKYAGRASIEQSKAWGDIDEERDRVTNIIEFEPYRG